MGKAMIGETMRQQLGQFLDTVQLPGRVLFAKVWGSWSHNTQMPTSDVDYLAVYASPTAVVLSLSPPPDTVDGKGPDYQAHEARKFCELLLKGNPAILEMLYTDRAFQGSDEWAALLAHRDRFLTKRAVNQYVGYARGQLQKLFKGSYLHTSGGEYSEKWAYHLVRILLDAKRIAEGFAPIVWKEGAERDLLMQIRGGTLAPDRVEAMARQLMAEIESLLEQSSLPEQGDRTFLNQWLLDIRRREFHS